VYKRNGEVLAKPHPMAKSSFALNEASSKRSVAESTFAASYKDPNMKQALTAYHPNAIRNRLPVTFAGEAKPAARFCQPRNVGTYNFMEGTEGAGYQRFRTTSNNYFAYDTTALEVGASNSGIVSEKAKQIHAKQQL